MFDFRKKHIQILTLAILAIVWGSSFILMKRGLESFSNTQVASMRIFFAGLFLLPFAFKFLKSTKSKNMPAIFFVGFIGNFVPAYLFTKAQTVLPSSSTGMLNSLVPIFTLIIGLVIFKAKSRFRSVLGVILGLIGALGLILFQPGSTVQLEISWYPLLVVLATICYASSVNIIKYYLGEVDPLAITSIAFMMVGTLAGIHLGFDAKNLIQNFTYDSLSSLFYVLILGVIGTALAVLLFNVLIKHTTAVYASTVTYLIPIVAIVWGLIDGETINSLQVTAMLFILGGVYLIRS